MRFSYAMIGVITLDLIGATLAQAEDLCSTRATTPDAIAPITKVISDAQEGEIVDMDAVEKELLNLLNEERKGLQRLTESPLAKEAARIHTIDAATTMDKKNEWIFHESNDESIDTLPERLRVAEKTKPRERFAAFDENTGFNGSDFDYIASVHNDPKLIAKRIHESYMRSEAHKENILTPIWNHVGISVKFIKIGPSPDGKPRRFLAYQMVSTFVFAEKTP